MAVADKIEQINKQIEQGELVITDETILAAQTEKQKTVDAVTAPTMATLFRLKSQEYLAKKQNSKE
jgi:uncharacterized protein (DUF39 family)